MAGWRGVPMKGFNKCQEKKNEKRQGGGGVGGGVRAGSGTNPLYG